MNNRKGFIIAAIGVTAICGACGVKQYKSKMPDSMIVPTVSESNAPAQEYPASQSHIVSQNNISANEAEESAAASPSSSSAIQLANSACLLDKLYENKKDNVLISPMSLNMALGMIENGAGGATKEALDKFLGTTDFNSTAKSIMDRYYGDLEDIKATHEATESGWHEPVSAMNVSDSVWVSDKRTIVPSFKDKVEDIYKAEVSSINTDDAKGSADKINNWCSDHTAGLIPQIINERHITPDTSMILVNTVYFNSSWREEWYPKEGSFTDVSGDKKDMEVIRNEVNSYYENDQATAFGMNYLNGLEFIGIIPQKEGDFNISDIDIRGLLDSDMSDEYDEIYGEMPRLKYETDNDILKNTLSDLGLSVIFDPVKAEFPNIVEKDPNTWVDDVIQKCTIDLDEYGTEASAATAVMTELSGMAAMPERPKKIAEVILDRPFMYVIIDPTTEQIVFMGKVVTAE